MGDMVKGNVAFAEAALRAGMDIFAGYPITPSTEIMEQLSWRAEEEGVQFIQAENEISAINIVMGAAACGKRALTASSGPGMALKQEGLSYMADYGLYCVVIDCVRFGVGLGSLDGAQTDYLRDTRGGGQGDYMNIVLAPYSIQEAVNLIYESFDLAEKYRTPVIIMTEGTLGQMMEPCDYPPYKKGKLQTWAFDGKYTNKRPPRHGSFPGEQAAFRALKQSLYDNEQRYEADGLEDADYIFVSFGLPGRATMGAVKQLQARGEKVGFIRPISLSPYPEAAFRKVNKKVKGIITVETNFDGQMNIDAALFTKKHLGDVPVYTLAYINGVPKLRTICHDFEEIKAGRIKEVY